MSVLRRLGALSCASETNQDLAVIGSGEQALVTLVNVCNRQASAKTFRLAHVLSGESIANKDWVFYDVALGSNETKIMQLQITMSAGDKLIVYVTGTTDTVSVGAWGVVNP
jgi:hypothetical protein